MQLRNAIGVICAAIILYLLSFPTYAAGRLHPNGDVVKGLKITSDGGFQGIFSSDHGNPDNCNGNKNTFIVLADHPGKEAMLSVVLAAKVSGLPVTVYVNGCYSDNGPIVHTLDLL